MAEVWKTSGQEVAKLPVEKWSVQTLQLGHTPTGSRYRIITDVGPKSQNV